MMRRFAILLAGCTAVASSAVPPSSRAEIDPDAGAASGIAQCGAQYAAGHDPSGLWSRLDSKTAPKIKIITTRVPADGTGTKTRDGDDGIQIFWDPNQTSPRTASPPALAKCSTTSCSTPPTTPTTYRVPCSTTAAAPRHGEGQGHPLRRMASGGR